MLLWTNVIRLLPYASFNDRVRQSQGSASLATRQQCNKMVHVTVIIIGKNVGEVFMSSREGENQRERTTPLSIYI